MAALVLFNISNNLTDPFVIIKYAMDYLYELFLFEIKFD